MRFSDSFLDDIRARVPISAVIGPRVSWDRRKTNAARGDWWACCPFHGEKSPSFHCEDRKGRYHCFGCSVSGDHFRFLTELDGIGFPEAVERLADMAGLPMPARDEQAEARDKQRASLHDVMEMAARFFEERLQSADGAKARAYLRERGLAAATQQSFRLGYAPDSRNALKQHLAARGAAKDQIEACGLVVFGDDIAVSYDRFRDRIMFPIADARERIIAFGGRALSSDAPAKYLNSPETELFHKGRVLYNFARARKAMQRDGTLIAVEGYMDVIALAQAGIGNAVAPLGTALTEMQMELLWRVSGEPVLCFDGDQAGLRAAWRAAEMLLPSVEPGRTARFALLPDGKDPDDLVKASGAAAFAEVLADAKPLSELLWLRETAGAVFETPERRAELERRLRELAGRIRDESVRFHYLQDFRDRVQAFFGRDRGRPRSNAQAGERRGAGAAWQGPQRIAASDRLAKSALVRRAGQAMGVREAALVVAMVNHPDLIDEFFERIEWLELDDPELKRLHAAVLDALASDRADSRDAFLASITRAGCGDIWERAVALLRRMRQWPALEQAALEDAREAFAQALHLHHSARTLHRELKVAEAALASDLSDENYRHLVDVQAQVRESPPMEALIEGFGVSSGRTGRS